MRREAAGNDARSAVFDGARMALRAVLVSMLLGGCAANALHDGRIDRLSAEQTAALAAGRDPVRAGEATRLTEQADREAAAARARQAAIERERARELRRQQTWDLRYGIHGYRGYGAFGLGYPGGYPYRR